MSATPAQLRAVATMLEGPYHHFWYDHDEEARHAYVDISDTPCWNAISLAATSQDRYLRTTVALRLRLDAALAEQATRFGPDHDTEACSYCKTLRDAELAAIVRAALGSAS